MRFQYSEGTLTASQNADRILLPPPGSIPQSALVKPHLHAILAIRANETHDHMSITTVMPTRRSENTYSP